MTLQKILTQARDKDNFKSLDDFINFSKKYLEYVAGGNLQAEIVSQNEHHYKFYQYKKEGYFQITRPLNSKLIYNANDFENAVSEYLRILNDIKHIQNLEERQIINKTTYTIQQTIGATLDALPPGESNTARKLNGDLFELFIRLIISELNIPCESGVMQVPVVLDGEEAFSMNYQHDLIIKENGTIKVLGSIKTSSKDRIDKIFVDKFLYSKLTDTNIPHIAIFLNDVQRKNVKKQGKYGISATFLPGHFKGYTVKLNPLDGVYYCDIRPNMLTESILKDHIKTFDKLLCDDIWTFLEDKSDI